MVKAEAVHANSAHPPVSLLLSRSWPLNHWGSRLCKPSLQAPRPAGLSKVGAGRGTRKSGLFRESRLLSNPRYRLAARHFFRRFPQGLCLLFPNWLSLPARQSQKLNRSGRSVSLPPALTYPT